MQKIPYATIIDSLIYTMMYTRANIAYAISVINCFLSNPRKKHWAAVKQILRYLRGTFRLCLYFGINKPVLDGYTDVYMICDVDYIKFTLGFLMTLSGELSHIVVLIT